LIRFTESAIAISGDVSRLALQFVLWVSTAQDHLALRPFAALCVLLLAINEGCEDIRRIWEWCIAVEMQARTALGNEVESEVWLIGLNSYEEMKDRRKIWADVAGKLLVKNSGHTDYTAILTAVAARLKHGSGAAAYDEPLPTGAGT